MFQGKFEIHKSLKLRYLVLFS